MRSLTAAAACVALSIAACAPADATRDATVPIRTVHNCAGPSFDGGRTVCMEMEGTGTPTCNGGVLADGPCDRAGISGGCRVVQGENSLTSWYYGTPAMTVHDLCSAIGATFVSP